MDLGIDDVANLQSQGKDIVLFYNVENGLSMNLVVRNNILKDRGVTANSPLDQKIKALKGLRIGITRPGAVTQLFPSYMMKTIGLDPKETPNSFKSVAVPHCIQPSWPDKIDAFMLSAPNPEKVVADGVEYHYYSSGKRCRHL